MRSRAILRDLYWPVSGALLAVLVAVAVQRPGSGDLGMHAATVARLETDLLNPGDPLVDSDTPSPYYSPYTLLLALIARATGITPVGVLWLVGPVCAAVFLYGLWTFVRTLSTRRYAPLVVLVCTMALWGLRPRVWSGFLSLWSLPLTMAYPSTLALGLTLILWAALNRTLDRGSVAPWRHLGLGLLLAAIGLTHPITFVIAGMGAAAILVSRLQQVTITVAGWQAGAAAVAVAVLLVWPYYPFFTLFTGVGGFDDVHKLLYDRPWVFYGLAVVALPALWLRWRRSRLDPLVLLFLAAFAIVLLGWVTDRHALGRLWPAVLLPAHVALGVELCEPLGRLARRAWVPVTALAVLVGLAVHAGRLVEAVPRPWLRDNLPAVSSRINPWPDYSWIQGHVRNGDVVLTDDYFAIRTMPVYGARTIAPAWPQPFLDDEALRWHEVAVLKDPLVDPAVKRDLLLKHHARWLLETPGKWSISGDTEPVVVGPKGQRLYRVADLPMMTGGSDGK